MRKLMFAALFMTMLLFSAFCDGKKDTIHFKDGKSITGRITERESFPKERVTIIDEQGKTRTFDLADIERITSSAEDDSVSGEKDDPRKTSGEAFDAPGFFAVNYLGLLQFGPIFHYGFRVAQDIYLIPHLRLQGLGALSWILFGESTSFIDSALGLMFQVQQPLGGGPNSMYYGIGLECQLTADNGFFSGPPTANGIANIGYRWWNSGKRSFLNVGVIGGISYDFNDDYLFPVIMLELSSGWGIGAR